jgi:hypothetical protein
MYMAIDKQVRQGAPMAVAVQHATKQLALNFAGLQEKVDRTIREKLDDLKGGNSDSIRQITEAVNQALQVITLDVGTLIEQGRSVTEVESKVKEATATLQNYLATLRLPTVRGEEGEKDVLRELEEAFLGQTCVQVEPIGGADATDVIVKFYHGGIEIGRSLVEVKSRKSWSNDYLGQVRQDMKRYNTAFAILAVEKLPKVAKPRGFHVDMEEGVVVTAPPNLVVSTITMFYEIHATSYRLQKRSLDLKTLTSDRDLAYFINDNMKILEDCKKIADVVDDSSRRIKDHTTHIGSRLQDNNGKIAEIFMKVSKPE